MKHNMFCFQCEQTAGCTGCTGRAGVCGKQADTANLQDALTGALIALARTIQGKQTVSAKISKQILDGLFTTVTNVNFNDVTIQQRIDAIHRELPAGTADYDMKKVWDAQEDMRSLKSLILFGIRGMAAYAYHAMILGYTDAQLDAFFVKALCAVGEDTWGMDELLPIVLEVGEKNLACMALLDKANTETYGTPAPTTIPLTVEKGPFIVVTGHDLYDLKCLLEQTKDKGVAVYTHGEMLPAHGYPELKKYPQLKGNFGTAWQNQQKEFDNIPAPILFTTNCLIDRKSTRLNSSHP